MRFVERDHCLPVVHITPLSYYEGLGREGGIHIIAAAFWGGRTWMSGMYLLISAKSRVLTYFVEL